MCLWRLCHGFVASVFVASVPLFLLRLCHVFVASVPCVCVVCAMCLWHLCHVLMAQGGVRYAARNVAYGARNVA